VVHRTARIWAAEHPGGSVPFAGGRQGSLAHGREAGPELGEQHRGGGRIEDWGSSDPVRYVGAGPDRPNSTKLGEDAMSTPLIHLEAVKKVFVTDEVETHALADVHFDIFKGDYISISGPSGCGKSTLLAILGLLDSPSDGEYVLNGRPVENLKMSERARIRNREIGF